MIESPTHLTIVYLNEEMFMGTGAHQFRRVTVELTPEQRRLLRPRDNEEVYTSFTETQEPDHE